MVFTGKELVITQFFPWRVIGGFTKNVGKLKSNVDFYSKRCVEGENSLLQTVLLTEVIIEPIVKLECVPKFCYFSDTLGAGGRVEEAARA